MPLNQTMPVGGWIGILGGGQLGRMMALAAAELGLHCYIFTPEANSPASQVAARTTQADYTDFSALDRFAASVDVITLEFENIPVETITHLTASKPVRPGADVLRITQDRLLEKEFAQAQGAGTAAFAAIDTPTDLTAAIQAIPGRAVLKTRRFGYDGKGQIPISDKGGIEELSRAWDKLQRMPCLLEGFVTFDQEISVIVARGLNGELAAYPPVENRHKHHILDLTLAPAELPSHVATQATEIACKIAKALNLVGLITVEMFVTKDGRILVNELAPRVHNSGHWTIEGCLTSQFQQHVRAICGWPLGPTTHHANAAMKNLIGEDIKTFARLLADPRNKVHLYGKGHARPGRKMGHVTRLFPLDTKPQDFDIG